MRKVSGEIRHDVMHGMFSRIMDEAAYVASSRASGSLWDPIRNYIIVIETSVLEEIMQNVASARESGKGISGWKV